MCYKDAVSPYVFISGSGVFSVPERKRKLMLTIGSVEKFAEYSQFKDKNDFNRQMEMFQAVHKNDFTKTEYMLFKRLLRFCVRVPGIATASIKTILEGTKLKDFIMGASESTFHRMKRKAIKLGILEVRQTERKNSSTSSNLWIFKRFVSVPATIDTPQTQGERVQPVSAKGKVFSQLTPLKTSITNKTNNKINKRIGTAALKDLALKSSLDHTYTRDYVPNEFTQTVKPFFNDAKKIEEYWKMVQIFSYDYKNSVDATTVLSTAMHSFKQMIASLKAGKIKTKPIAYFTGVLKRQLDGILQEISEADSSADRKGYYTNVCNWLEETQEE